MKPAPFGGKSRRYMNRQGLAEITPLVYSLFILMMFAVLYVDLYGYFYLKNNLRQAVDETLTMMKAENGFDERTRGFFEQAARKLGLDPTRVGLQGTPKPVQRGDPVELSASTDYEIRGLRPLNKTLKVQITVHSVGLAHTKIR